MTKFYLFLVGMLFVFAAAPLYAQPDTPSPTSPFEWYTSVTGVVGATILGVSILKRALGNVSGLNMVPTWLYAVVISCILTFLTVQVWGTLPAPLWQTMMQAVIMAAAASGFYEWLHNAGKPIAASAASAGVHIRDESLRK